MQWDPEGQAALLPIQKGRKGAIYRKGKKKKEEEWEEEEDKGEEIK